MKKPETLNIIDRQYVSCGVQSICMVLNSLGYKVLADELESMLREKIPDLKHGAIYTSKQMQDVLEIINQEYGISYEEMDFNNELELKNTIEQYKESSYMLIPYYAFQGLVWQQRKPNMIHGHWAVVYDMKDGKIFGVQSNQKGEMLGVLSGVGIKQFFDSNKTLSNIKVNWGKYHKCEKHIPKQEYGFVQRCGLDHCKITGCNQNCIFTPDIHGRVYRVYLER